MTGPTLSQRRVDRLPGGVGALLDRVPDDAIDECLRMLTVSVVDIAGIGDRPAVRDVLDQLHPGQPVSASAVQALTALGAQFEFDASVAHRAGNLDAQRLRFRGARAVGCLGYAVGSTAPRARLADAVYEAAMAMGGSAGVVAVLAEFVP
ncbi:hypothetical protein GCM10009624_22230 [Gordonia sinesedis]